MWIPPDPGKEYIRELERKQRQEAEDREARTGRYSLQKHQLSVGQKPIILGVGLVALLIILIKEGDHPVVE
jgi:hypothetical protein